MAAESKGSGIGRWIMWLIFGELVLIAVLTPMLGKGGMDWLVKTERQMSLSEVGFSATLWIEKTGFGLYADLFRDTGVEKNVYDFFLPSQDQIKESKGLEALGARLYFPMVQSGLDSLFGSLQRLFVRMTALALWLPTVPLILIPAILDGMMTWRRKQFSFDYASPLVHGYAAGAAKWLVIGLPLALLLPVPIPPLVFPFVFIVLSFLLMLVTAHTMKRI